VPCWVDTTQPDVDRAVRFYGELFGWEMTGAGTMPSDPPGNYYVARADGHEIAGVGEQPGELAGTPSTWATYISVGSADEAAAAVRDAGGAVLHGPFDAPPAGRMAVVQDPSGAIFNIWEPRERHGAERVNSLGAWAMSALMTDDPEGAQAFYGQVFGWEAEAFGDGAWVWRLPGYVGGVPQQPVPLDVVAAVIRGEQAGWAVDFWIASADDAAAKAQQLGGTVLVAPHDEPGFRRTVVADPAGAVLGLSEPR
jgi:hypothetical protein